MTILLSGGGTGGHITPILAVARELKRLDPTVRLIYIGERKGKFAFILRDNTDIDEVYSIFAGKFRRYHNESWLIRIFDIKTTLLNVRDLFYFIFGLVQSVYLLGKIRPDIIFLKGGFVGVPVGLAAAFRRLRFITHDSDVLPGLANRLVSRWARIHAVGMPVEFYNYPKKSIKFVGVLVGENHKPVTKDMQLQYRKQLGLPLSDTILLVTGGSLGALRLNQAFSNIQARLLSDYPDLFIIHQVGKGNKISNELPRELSKRLMAAEFLEGMYRYSGAADLIVTRAGATNLAEFGVQGKACIIVPNPLLTGGHQLKNAEYLIRHDAVVSIPETSYKTDDLALEKAIRELLNDKDRRQAIAKELQAITPNNAAHYLAQTILDQAKKT